jgi:ABC-type dipeptide/oligopeptide/nickel transport system ATPase component
VTDSSTLRVRDLRVTFPTRRGTFAAVDGVSLDVARGETLGVVGESGSGKTISMLAILGLLPPGPMWHVEGTAELNGKDLLRLSQRELRKVRGGEVAMIFQNPTSSLNPVFSIGDQIREAIRNHQPRSARSIYSTWSAFPTPPSASASTHMNSRAAWRSAR